MKMRLLSFLSVAGGYALLMSSAMVGGAGCGGSGSGGSTGGGGSGATLDPDNLISNFEDLAAATVVNAPASAPRNGYWYPYNDDNPGGTDTSCKQEPISGPQAMAAGVANPTYVGTAPPSGTHDPASTLALHGKWMGCGVWGAGIGADLNQPMLADGGTYMGKKVVYDVSQYTGVTFWAMAKTDTDTSLRMKFPMSDETKIVDGGDCDDAAIAPLQCSDDFGEQFNLPSNGTWKQFTIKWADAGFKQEGWGKGFTWNPQHVTSIQVQSVDKNEAYDFWIDDIYFIK